MVYYYTYKIIEHRLVYLSHLKNKTLRELDLSFNEVISDDAESYITEGLKKNTILKTLNLNFCSITGEGIRLIQSSNSTCKIYYAR